MNPKKLQALGLVLGLALFTATGLLVLTGADRPALRPVEGEVRPVSDASVASLRALSDTFAEVSAHVKPSVVTVYSEKTVKLPDSQWPFGGDFPFRFFFGDENQPQPRRPMPRGHSFKQSGMGSGIVVDKDGRILTNHHVVREMDDISVKLSTGAKYDAELVGVDPKTDLAVIRIKGKVPRDLVPAEIGDSEALRVGDWVLAIGAPFGYEQTVTAGIISAKGRSGIDRNSSNYEDFIQTDAAINPGNSGGPLVNLKGEVVGINSAIATSVGQFAGVGFAIPINMAKHVMNDLISSGKVTRGFLGVGIQDLNEDLAEQFGVPDSSGVLVAQVSKDSAADKAGLKVGDVIHRFEGWPVENTRQLRNLVADTAPGKKVAVAITRAGKERTLTVQVGELPSDQELAQASPGGEPSSRSAKLGLIVQTLTDKQAKELGYEGEQGVLVGEVADGSPAAAAELQPGDLITEVNREKAASVADFHAALDRAKEKDSVLMLVKREGGSRFVIVRTK